MSGAREGWGDVGVGQRAPVTIWANRISFVIARLDPAIHRLRKNVSRRRMRLQTNLFRDRRLLGTFEKLDRMTRHDGRDRVFVDKLAMPASALAAMAKAVPTDLVQDIARDNCPRAAPTPPAPKNIVESLLKRAAVSWGRDAGFPKKRAV